MNYLRNENIFFSGGSLTMTIPTCSYQLEFEIETYTLSLPSSLHGQNKWIDEVTKATIVALHGCDTGMTY